MDGFPSLLCALWRDYSFIVLFAFVTAFVGWRMPKRPYFIPRVVCCIIALLALSFGLNSLETFLGRDYMMLAGGGKFVIQYAACAGCMILCFDCGIMAASFCATIGYSVQHISQRMTQAFMSIFSDVPYVLRFVSNLTVCAVACFAIWYFSIRRQKSAYVNIRIESPVQLIITAVMLLSTVFIEMQFFIIGAGELMAFEYLLSSICAFMAIIVEINILSNKHMADDFKMLQQMLSEEREKYLQEKTNIDMINLKCHDIRHQLRAMEGKISADALRELGDTVDIYSSQIKTGNDAIDVAMAKHILYCLNNKIRFTCLLDGTYLSFIPDHELYALFGNAVENAVTAVSGLEEEKKVISITSIVKGGFMNICITNYFDGSIMMRDGLPMSENDGHGFGVRSMRMIVEKYGGRMSVTVKEDLFMLNMFFPLSSAAAIAGN